MKIIKIKNQRPFNSQIPRKQIKMEKINKIYKTYLSGVLK